MFRIIDRTLVAIDRMQEQVQGEKLFEVGQFLVQTGVHYIELSVPVLAKDGEAS